MFVSIRFNSIRYHTHKKTHIEEKNCWQKQRLYYKIRRQLKNYGDDEGLKKDENEEEKEEDAHVWFRGPNWAKFKREREREKKQN